MKTGITYNEFTIEARIYFTIIYIRVSLCTSMTYILVIRDQMLACLLENIPLNIGRFILSEIRYYKNRGCPILLYASFITELCKRVEVEEYPRDNWISPKTPIYLLKIHCMGVPSKNKKKKIDLGKSVDDDIDPCWPFIAGSFDKLSNEIRSIRELIFGLLTGLEEPSTNRHRKLHRLTMIDF